MEPFAEEEKRIVWVVFKSGSFGKTGIIQSIDLMYVSLIARAYQSS